MWYLFRRRKRPVSEAWTAGTPYTASTSRNTSMSAVGANATKNENWAADQLYNDGFSMAQSSDGMAWHNQFYDNVGMPAPPIPSQPYYHGVYSSHSAMHQPQMTERMPNRYEAGYALSTITERSTLQMGERTPPANSPSYLSELEHYTTQGSEVNYSSRQQQQLPSSLGRVKRPPTSNIQGYPSVRRKPGPDKPAGNWI